MGFCLYPNESHDNHSMSEDGNNIFDLLKNDNFIQWIVSPTEESIHYWSKWVTAHPERKEDVELARRIVLSSQQKINDKMPSEDYDEVLEYIVDYSQKKKSKDVPFRSTLWKAIGIAATIAIAFFMTVFGSKFINSAGEENKVTEIVKKINPRGQKMTIRLPDGTKVILNSESSLEYQSVFNENERRIYLKGEAFFDVVKNPNKPFIVETKYLETIALGTSFNIEAYPGEKEEITLVTGKVKVNSNREGIKSEFLIPGEKVQLVEDSLKKTSTPSLDHVKWKDNVLVFRETPFERGILELERWYGVDIQIENFPKNRDMNFTGFYEDQSLSNILESIGYAMRFDFTIIEKQVIIKFK